MDKRIVCAGTFDHFHPGHIDFLAQAKSLGSLLIVIVARDETVRRIKGFLPNHNEEIRKKNVQDSKLADMVILGNYDEDILKILDEIKPDVVALGYDQRVNEDAISNRFPHLKIVRMQPFHSDKYKSSFYRLLNQKGT